MFTKKELTDLERKIRNAQIELDKLAKQEERVRSEWRKRYDVYNNAVETITDMAERYLGSKYKTISALAGRIKGWKEQSRQSTAIRDRAREAMREAAEHLTKSQIELDSAVRQNQAEIDLDDGIVGHIFDQRDEITTREKALVAYLEKMVYTRLFDKDGNLRTQVTINNRNLTRRVVARVNTVQFVKQDLAEQAMELLKEFRDKFKASLEVADISGKLVDLFDIIDNLFYEKKEFKVGPFFWRFQRLRLKETDPPELIKAQELLAGSIRSEKTTPYIRLFERASEKDRWVPVKLRWY